jgi:crossover junction endodeoxyribonuclease RuvC
VQTLPASNAGLPVMTAVARILGIDPGSRVTGYGLLDTDGIRTVYVASGRICTQGGPLPARLRRIYDEIGNLSERYDPDEVAVESVFMHKNADSALKLGQARAAAICGTFVSDSDIHEYAARAVKQAVVGAGAADKVQIQHMIRKLLGLTEELDPDEADALAVALCHANTRRLAARLDRQRGDAA